MLETQMFAQFLSSLQSTDRPKGVVPRPKSRAETAPSETTASKLGMKFNSQVFNDTEDENDEMNGHVDLWSIVSIASQMNDIIDSYIDAKDIHSGNNAASFSEEHTLTRHNTPAGLPPVNQPDDYEKNKMRRLRRRNTPEGFPPVNQPVAKGGKTFTRQKNSPQRINSHIMSLGNVDHRMDEEDSSINLPSTPSYGNIPATPPPPPAKHLFWQQMVKAKVLTSPQTPNAPTTPLPPPRRPPPNTPPPSQLIKKHTYSSATFEEINSKNEATFSSLNKQLKEEEEQDTIMYNTLLNKLCRPSDTDPVRTLHHNIASKSSDAMMTETEKKINDKGERVEAFLMSQDQGLQLVCFPSPSSIVLEKKDTEQFITHTCLWGHYKLRSLNSSLYGEKPKMVDEEDESDEEVSVMTSFPSMLSPAGTLDDIDDAVSGDEEDEEGDTFAENTLLSPSGASVSTPSSTTPTTNKSKSKRRPSLRTTNSFRQKGRNKTFTRQNAKNKESNKQKKKQTGQSKKIRTRRTSMFAAVGTNDLSYLGVSANRFAEIQSSIWSTMLPTMGKVSSTINKRGRRMSMIGGGGLKKSPRKKKESVLQKMMKQHAEDATKETKVIQTPRNKKNLRRGNSVGIMRTPLRSDVGGSGGQKGRFGRTPGKSTVKKGGSRLGHHKSESLDMNQPNWNESVVSPSMNTLISKRLHNLSLDNVRSIGKQRIDLKKRLVALEKEMKKASVTAMVRWHQLKKAKNGTEGNMKPRQSSATPGTAMQEEEEEEGSMYQRQLSGTAMHEEEEEEEEEVTEYSEYDGF